MKYYILNPEKGVFKEPGRGTTWNPDKFHSYSEEEAKSTRELHKFLILVREELIFKECEAFEGMLFDVKEKKFISFDGNYTKKISEAMLLYNDKHFRDILDVNSSRGDDSNNLLFIYCEDLIGAKNVKKIKKARKLNSLESATQEFFKGSEQSKELTFRSTKVFDGFSTVFRQWKANGTHCKYLHGYGVSFKIIFEGELDEKNWVWDFGGMKRAVGKIDGMSPKNWMDYMFDHTTIIAEDDPHLSYFTALSEIGALQLRILPTVGAERFAQYIFEKVDKFIEEETQGRVKVIEVEFKEHDKNSAIYSR